MAGTGWDAAGIDASITISGDGQTATRTGGNSDTFCVRGLAGRSKGRRYFEITPGSTSFNSYVGAGFIDSAGSLGPHTLGLGSPIQGGWRAASGQFTYSYASGSGSREDGPDESEGVLGILIDFDDKTCEVYKDGVLKFTEVMDIPNDTVLFPACGLYDNDTEATLQTVEPFQYPPAETYIAWDEPDSALASKVSGVMKIDGAPVARLLKAFTHERLAFDLNGKTITESKPLGQTVSDETSGDYEIILRDGFSREVVVVAFDDYGEVFTPDLSVVVGDRIHPTTPNSYVYVCSAAGTLPSEEPTWSTDTTSDQLVGTASFTPTVFWRAEVHGPIKPEVFQTTPELEVPPSIRWRPSGFIDRSSGPDLIKDEMALYDLFSEAVTVTTINSESALYFNGSTAKGYTARLPLDGDFTIIAWVSFPDPLDADGAWLINNRTNTSVNDEMEFQVAQRPGLNEIGFPVWNDQGAFSDANAPLGASANEKKMVAVTIKGNDQRTYIDGQLSGNATFAGNRNSGAELTFVGFRGWGEFSNEDESYYGEFHLYGMDIYFDRALTAERIQEIYNTGN